MKDEWLRAAIFDDALVADLLLRLRDFSSGSHSDFPHPPVILRPIKGLPPTWGLRQPRSKSQSPEEKEAPRSPTTPLLWGGGSEGCEESSSQPPPSDRFRSKISATTETLATTSKRPRRKKTFAELKEEEGSLLKEQTYLKKKLEKLRLTLKERRSMNEKLKRMKLDLHVESVVKSDANHHEPDRQNMTHNCASSEATSSNMSRPVKCEYNSEPDSCQEQKVAKSLDAVFVLPDLNMIPDEDSVQELGMS